MIRTIDSRARHRCGAKTGGDVGSGACILELFAPVLNRSDVARILVHRDLECIVGTGIHDNVIARGRNAKGSQRGRREGK